MRWGLFLLDEEFVDLGLEVGRQGRDAVSLLKADEFVVVHVDFVVLAQLFQFLLVGVIALRIIPADGLGILGKLLARIASARPFHTAYIFEMGAVPGK